ncbi:hypothetical protein [Dyella sp. A6]|uniref:hypothetical protein n=1 Tax=Dyella aluminiiresistens TaxID=3069105 RepID=UPI002E771190|nr:hypothetical protein [Dyella sp. A6]
MDKRVITGFLISPLLPSAVAAVVLSGSTSNWSALPAQLALMIGIAELAALLFGVPIYFLVKRFRPIGMVECVGSGVVIGLLAGLVGVLVGAVSGLIFWLIAVKSASAGPNHSSKRTREKPRAA